MKSKKQSLNIKSFYRNSYDLTWLDYEIQMSLDSIKELLKSIDSSWRVTIEKLNVEIKKAEEESGNSNYYPYDNESSFLNEIKNRGNMAVFLTSYAILEGSLNKICNFIEDKIEFKIKINDLNSKNLLELYKNYLIKVYELEFTKFDPEWARIAKYGS